MTTVLLIAAVWTACGFLVGWFLGTAIQRMNDEGDR